MKNTIFIIFAVLIMIFIDTLPGVAARAGDNHGSGNYQRSRDNHGSVNYRRSGNYHRSSNYHRSGYYRGPRYYYGGSIWIGPGWDPWWGYPYYPYPYYPAPPVINQQQPIYVEPVPQQEEQSYWYYCPDPQGYYPYVQKCPKGWMKVIPSPAPADEGE